MSASEREGRVDKATWEPMKIGYLGHVTELVMAGGEPPASGKLSIPGDQDPTPNLEPKKPKGIG